MTDLLIVDNEPGPGWDLAIVDGDVVLTGTLGRAAEVAQRVVYRLKTWLGESVYDRRAGQPYFDGIFGEEPVEGVVAALLQVILDTEGVDDVVGDPEFELTPGRELTIAATIVVGDDTAPVNLTVAA